MVYAIGEAVIDRITLKDGSIKEYVGGAPFNVCGMLATLKVFPYFIGKVGNDLNGQKIIEAAEKKGILKTYLKVSQNPTCVIEVMLDQNNDRSFIGRTLNSADCFLDVSDVEKINFCSDDILYFGSLILNNQSSRSALDFCLNKIKNAHGFICFDPNIRSQFFTDFVSYRQLVKKYIKIADCLKLSLDDMEFLFPKLTEEEVISKILKGSTQMVLLTKGAMGACLYTKECKYESVYSKEYWDIVDSTGAGDIFVGAFLYYYSYISKERLQKALSFATLAATLSCTEEGGFDSAPSLSFMDVFWEGEK